jgi:hypothetical protein
MKTVPVFEGDTPAHSVPPLSLWRIVERTGPDGRFVTIGAFVTVSHTAGNHTAGAFCDFRGLLRRYSERVK